MLEDDDVECASPDRFADVSLKDDAPPVASSMSVTARLLVFVATCLAVLTYFEDAIRCITMWEEQLSFVAKHSGLPRAIASALLLVIAGLQLSSALLAIPPTLFPCMARPAMVVCLGVAFSVLVQPILFNQLSNFELLILSLAQLGAAGLVFAEAHFVAELGRHAASTRDGAEWW